MYDQPITSTDWLKQFKLRNEAFLKQVKLTFPFAGVNQILFEIDFLGDIKTHIFISTHLFIGLLLVCVQGSVSFAFI